MDDSDSDSALDVVAPVGGCSTVDNAAPLIGCAGHGTSVISSRKRALLLLEKMRTSPLVPPAVSAAVPFHFNSLTEAHWTNKALYELFAGFLAETYVQEVGPNQGSRLNFKTALNYLGALVQAAKGMCKDQSAEARLFFACADTGASTEHSAWYRGLRRNLANAMFRKAVEDYQRLDYSPTPLFIGHLRSMVRVILCVCCLYSSLPWRSQNLLPITHSHLHPQIRALSCHANNESEARVAAEKALVLVCSHLTCGRAAEVSWLKYTSRKWNPHLRCFFVTVPMTKTHKVKIIALVAGVDRHCDFFLALADYLSVGPRVVYKEGDIAWVFPNLRAVTGLSRALAPPLGGG